MAKKSVAEQTVVETTPDGTKIVHHHIREWKQHAPESLPQIEAAIDAWDRRMAAAGTPRSRREDLDRSYVEAQVDRLTKKVKGSRKEVVTETVTEWVEGPMGSGPINVEEPAVASDDAAWSEKQFKPKAGDRPKRRFSWFGARKDKPAKQKKAKKEKPAKAEARKDTSEADYQPQCAALTEDGAQCRNSARGDSKYCISHKGYQPPTTKGLAKRIEGDAWDPRDNVTDRSSVRSKDTRPAVRKARDTTLRTRKPAKRGKSGRKKR